MLSALIIGIDVGTTNAKAAAFTPSGEQVAQAVCSYPTRFPTPGWADQRPLDWCEALEKVLRELSAALGERAKEVVCIGLSAHCPSLVPVGADGDPLLEYCPIWQDERSAAQAQHLVEEVGPEWAGLGMVFAAFPAKLLWFTREYPQLAAQARYALGIKGYLAHWLTGCYGTDASSEPGCEDRWIPTMAACGWSIDRLPPLLPMTGQVGGLRAELAKRFGLKAGLPVIIGMNDSGSAALANGACSPGDVIIQLSTNGVLFMVLEKVVPAVQRVEQALFCWPYVEGCWIGGGQTNAGGVCLQWFTNLLRGSVGPCVSVELVLDACRESPPCSNGVIFLPYLMGRGTPHFDPLAAGSFTGLRMDTSRADMGRAVLEGVAFALRDVLNVLGKDGNTAIRRVYIAGGGAQSSFWREIVANVLNLELHCACGESCLGAAMHAAVGVGLHPQVSQAAKMMSKTLEKTQPDIHTVAVYDAAYQKYCQMRDLLESPKSPERLGYLPGRN